MAPSASAVTSRYLTVLGTASRISTRERAVGGYALQWDDQLILFDPGEGFQRQCLLAGVAIGRATAVCITHFHGDHCLGLPGIIHRWILSGRLDKLPVYFPAAGRPYLERLLTSSVHDGDVVDPRPVERPGVIGTVGASTLTSQPLCHGVPTVGYRVQERDRMGLSTEGLRERGIAGPDVGRLLRAGSIEIGGRVVTVDELQVNRPGQAVAFVMDTAPCAGAKRLAAAADLMVCEATFLERHRQLANESMHLTAHQAALLARDAGVRRVVLSHFSGRYPDTTCYADEAGAVHDDVIVADDFGVVEVPARSSLATAHGVGISSSDVRPYQPMTNDMDTRSVLLPTTRSGRYSLLSVAAFAGLLAAFALAVALGERGGEEFFDNLLLALPGLGAYVAAVGAFVFGALAIVLSGERSLTVVAATIFGLLVTTFGVLEVLFPH